MITVKTCFNFHHTMFPRNRVITCETVADLKGLLAKQILAITKDMGFAMPDNYQLARDINTAIERGELVKRFGNVFLVSEIVA